MSKKPNFKAFKDWLDDGSAEPWPSFNEQDEKITVKQEKIIERNAKLLLDREAWSAHVAAFEKQLALIEDEDERSKTRAKYQIRFDHHTFSDDGLDFSHRHFPCSVSFIGATFGGGDVSFEGATFGDGQVSFDGATFGDGYVSFSRAIFGAEFVSFAGTIFGSGYVSFIGATFEDGYVLFVGIKLASTFIFFEDIDVGDNLLIIGVTFPEEASFQRASVKGTADFSDNIFHKVPNFLDTNFARPPEVAGMEVLPYAFTFMTPWWKGEKDEAAKFRKLKAMALAANDHEKDGEFFAYEMLAKRGYDKDNKSWVALFINWLYFTFSNFGQSYLRPLVCLGLSFCGFFLYYAINLGQLFITDERMTFAFWHSLRNTFPFVSSLFRFANKPKDFLLWYDGFFKDLAGQKELVETLVNASIAQNFIGLILLFLLLLGLRNKFRLK